MLNNKYTAIVLYLSVAIFYLVSLRNLGNFTKHIRRDVVESLDENMKKLGKFWLNFFTLWNFFIQILFLVIAILDEAIKLLGLPLGFQKRLSRTRAFLFNSLVFPSSLLVMTVFWSIWHLDRELIFPKAVDQFFPSWLNHTLHTFIVIPLLIELVLPKKYNFVKFKNAAMVLVVYTTVYQLLYTSIYFRHGVWLYPIYYHMTWLQRIVFSLAQLGLALVYQKIGIALQNRKKTEPKIKVK